jgi:hypothetical protein
VCEAVDWLQLAPQEEQTCMQKRRPGVDRAGVSERAWVWRKQGVCAWEGTKREPNLGRGRSARAERGLDRARVPARRTGSMIRR